MDIRQQSENPPAQAQYYRNHFKHHCYSNSQGINVDDKHEKKKWFQYVKSSKYAVVAEMQKILVILPYSLSMGINCIPSPSHCFKHSAEFYDCYPLLSIDRSGVLHESWCHSEICTGDDTQNQVPDLTTSVKYLKLSEMNLQA